jgi:Mce-associated membrane protein
VSPVSPSLYDLLDVDPTASDDEIRAAWKSAIADLDPTDRRFRAYNQAAEVLLDPERRAAYDAELGPEQEQDEDGPTEVGDDVDAGTRPGSEPQAGAPAEAKAEGRSFPAVPGWLLIGLAVLTLVVIAAAVYFWTQPSDSGIEEATRQAQSTAERAIVPVLSYDATTMAEDQAAGRAYLTDDYRAEYDKLFKLLTDNAAGTGTAVTTKVVSSGIVRSGEDRVEVLLFVDRPTTNNQQTEPVVYKDQVRVTMELVDGEWLIDDLTTSPAAP